MHVWTVLLCNWNSHFHHLVCLQPLSPESPLSGRLVLLRERKAVIKFEKTDFRDCQVQVGVSSGQARKYLRQTLSDFFPGTGNLP